LDGTLLDANATLLAVLGSRLDEVIAKPFWETPWFVNTPGMPDMVRAAVRSAAGGENVREEISVRLPSGTRTYDFSLRPIRDASGTVVAIVPEAIDITDRRLAEDALRQAQKMEAVGQLTGGIAHDFNNLLTGILGSLEIANARIAAGRSHEIARFTSAATTAAQRAAALTQRLLAFARRQPLDPKRVEANALIAGMEDLLRRTLGPSIGLEMVLAGDVRPTLCDANQLESAILNLVINARDAMPDSGRLTIETTNAHLDDAYARAQAGEVKPGYYVAISVTDTGTGMDPDTIARAFEPFFTTKPTGQGTGLGLSMLYGFVKQSDGHVRIYSEVGHGTSFKLYLPQFRGTGDNEIEDGAVAETAEATAEAGETVLVVDDEPAVRMLVTETLDELGYTAIEAPDGPSALRILQSSSRIDLLITDVGLPGLNGRQLADAARVTRPGLRVLFMTGYAHNAAISRGGLLDPGMEILTKPFAMSALVDKIRSIKCNG
jgi:signal transduction histidine kinase